MFRGLVCWEVLNHKHLRMKVKVNKFLILLVGVVGVALAQDQTRPQSPQQPIHRLSAKYQSLDFERDNHPQDDLGTSSSANPQHGGGGIVGSFPPQFHKRPPHPGNDIHHGHLPFRNAEEFHPSGGPKHHHHQKQQQSHQHQQPRGPQKRPQYPQGQGGQSGQVLDDKLTSSEERELQELEDEQKPDRLQELMVNSKFTCQGKKDGYYADDSLNCEVFHYCQAGGKHSWLCPDSFSFHQIHLICVPSTSSDNICQKSQDFHFVNDFLYKPINEKQAQVYNTSLKYADRYFPDGYGGESGNREVVLEYNGGNGKDRYFEDSVEQDGDDEEDQQGGRRGSGSVERGPPPQIMRVRPQHHQPQASPAFNIPRPHPPPPHQIHHHHHPPIAASSSFGPPPSIVTGRPQGFVQRHVPPQGQQGQSHPMPHRPRPQRHPQGQGGPHPQGIPSYFSSPSEINIPLSARRPVPNNKNFRPSPQLMKQQGGGGGNHKDFY